MSNLLLLLSGSRLVARSASESSNSEGTFACSPFSFNLDYMVVQRELKLGDFFVKPLQSGLDLGKQRASGRKFRTINNPFDQEAHIDFTGILEMEEK